MEFYQTELNETEAETSEIEKKYSAIGTIRFIVFLIMAVGLIVGFYDSNPIFLIVGIAAVIGFVALIFIHGKLNEKLEYLRAKAIVYKRYIARFTEDWKSFKENGSEYLSDEDLVAKDLDIIGTDSLFQFICTAGTEDGRQMLIRTLKQPE